jgi:hypothetical protein
MKFRHFRSSSPSTAGGCWESGWEIVRVCEISLTPSDRLHPKFRVLL